MPCIVCVTSSLDICLLKFCLYFFFFAIYLKGDGSPKVECVNCHLSVPMLMMRDHQMECGGGGSTSAAEHDLQSRCFVQSFLHLKFGVTCIVQSKAPVSQPMNEFAISPFSPREKPSDLIFFKILLQEVHKIWCQLLCLCECEYHWFCREEETQEKLQSSAEQPGKAM